MEIYLYIKPLSSDGTASNKKKKKKKKVNLSNGIHVWSWTVPSIFILDFTKCLSGQTDSVDQDQTAQTVQSDGGFTLSANLWDTFLSKI